MLEEQQGLLGHPEPAHTHKRRSARWGFPRFRTSLSFILIAIFSGILFYLLVFSVVLSKPSLRATGRKYIFGDDQEPYWPHPPLHDDFEYAYDEEHAVTSLAEFSQSSAPSATPTLTSEDGLLELSVDDLKAMVSRTKGYFVRDWSLALGWNNMRYIIEAAVLQAELLNRTLIIPSRVYARACEYHNEVCAKYTRMVNRNDALYTNEWRNLPIEKQMGFELPIEIMLDIPHLRQKHNVMLMSEYLHVQGLNITREKSNGGWDRAYYHQGIDRPSLFVIPNNVYDPETVARVDIMPPAPLLDLDNGNLNATVSHFESNNWLPDDEFGRDCNNRLLESLKNKNRAHLEWAEAIQALRGSSVDVTSDSAIDAALKNAGWVVLHTFEGALGMEYIKSVVNPIKHVARYPSLRGLKDDFHHVNQDVLLLEGEVHLGRKPGSVRFTTPEARDRFARTVLHDVIPPPKVKELALRIIKRMNDLNKNHLWLAGHMRRGDFVNVGWAMEGTIKHHLDRILQRLAAGRQILERIRLVEPQPYRVPDVHPNGFIERVTPVDGDFIYLATDERDNEALRLFKESHIKLFSDLVTMDDRREFGWPLLFSDVIALVEQQVIGLGAGYFYAHAMSSVAGGILNIRAASGCDSRTALLD
ncbi:hypothetical protein M408DRAFT_28494 [Serendipita vermifera MAFF 305830]|uniref:O-fucosyltransferase family protein n=1 Tax=Serendipita vermifera MAFF 305830 TaxID=933852 RepID=A0A0C2W8J4_SERVB|nr:hypothetical protein M408DRAFT_28494 [Serendipita vermifera MAFF 305830]